jgi:hypothetical protein
VPEHHILQHRVSPPYRNIRHSRLRSGRTIPIRLARAGAHLVCPARRSETKTVLQGWPKLREVWPHNLGQPCTIFVGELTVRACGGQDPAVRALVLTGEGRGFSSGADLAGAGPGRNRSGVQRAHLNPLGLFLTHRGLFLRTSIPFIWRVLSAFLPA